MLEAIYNLKIFSWMDKEIVERIILKCEEEKFSKGEIIIAEWEKSNGKWYIIKNGKVSIYIKWNKIAELWSWDIIWEIALLNEEIRTATVKALEDVETIVLTLDNLVEMINNDDNSINKKIIRRIEENLTNF